MLTFLGDVGGLFDIVMLMGSTLTMVFAARLFQGALVGEAYKVQNYFNDFTAFYETKRNEKLSTESVDNSSKISGIDINAGAAPSSKNESSSSLD